MNNGRGPVDFKASFGKGDSSLIEFKLANNTKLKQNLERQIAVYEAANKTHSSVKVIVFYTSVEEDRVRRIRCPNRLSERQQAVWVARVNLFPWATQTRTSERLVVAG